MSAALWIYYAVAVALAAIFVGTTALAALFSYQTSQLRSWRALWVDALMAVFAIALWPVVLTLIGFAAFLPLDAPMIDWRHGPGRARGKL